MDEISKVRTKEFSNEILRRDDVNWIFNKQRIIIVCLRIKSRLKLFRRKNIKRKF